MRAARFPARSACLWDIEAISRDMVPGAGDDRCIKATQEVVASMIVSSTVTLSCGSGQVIAQVTAFYGNPQVCLYMCAYICV